jgi:hypothetical protein
MQDAVAENPLRTANSRRDFLSWQDILLPEPKPWAGETRREEDEYAVSPGSSRVYCGTGVVFQFSNPGRRRAIVGRLEPFSQLYKSKLLNK